MITPQEIANKRFEKGRGGYRQDDVDSYLEEVANAYSTMINKNQELEKKLEVLAEQIEKYREDEDSLRAALVGAQKLGDSVIREAKTKAEYIVHDATVKADKIMEKSKKDIEREHVALVQIQKEVASFKNRLLSLYKQHLEVISNLPEIQQEEEPKQAVQEETPVAQPAAPAQPQPEPEPAPEPPVEEQQEETVIEYEMAAATRSKKAEEVESKFGPLKFGADYDFTKE